METLQTSNSLEQWSSKGGQ